MTSFGDFFEEPDGCAAELLSTALNGNRDVLQTLLTQVPVLQARPRLCSTKLSRVMESWTLREYVSLALLRAHDAGHGEKVEALSSVLNLVDEKEKAEAEGLARTWKNQEMEPSDARLFQQSLQGRMFATFQHSGTVSQVKLFNVTLHHIDPLQLQQLLQEEPEEASPLKTRPDLCAPCHPSTQHWPLRTYVLAKLYLQTVADNVEKLHTILRTLRAWERDLVEAMHAQFLGNFGDVASLKLLLQEDGRRR